MNKAWHFEASKVGRNNIDTRIFLLENCQLEISEVPNFKNSLI